MTCPYHPKDSGDVCRETRAPDDGSQGPRGLGHEDVVLLEPTDSSGGTESIRKEGNSVTILPAPLWNQAVEPDLIHSAANCTKSMQFTLLLKITLQTANVSLPAGPLLGEPALGLQATTFPDTQVHVSFPRDHSRAEQGSVQAVTFQHPVKDQHKLLEGQSWGYEGQGRGGAT